MSTTSTGLPWDSGITWRSSVITAPDELPVSVVEVRDDHLRLPNGPSEDTYVERLIKAAMAMGERSTRRAFAPQTSRLGLSGFPCEHIQLDRPPIIEVESLEYLDGDLAWQTFDADSYVVTLPAGPLAMPGRIDLAYGGTWPTLGTAPETVRVTYRHGYVTGSPEEIDLPADLTSAVLLLVGELYKQRSISVQMPNNTSAQIQAERIFDGYRVY